MLNTPKWITVISVGLPMEAQIIKAQLELHGIEVEILDEMTSDIAPFYTQAMGGIRIQVQEVHFEAAKELLIHLGHLKKEERKTNPIYAAFIKYSNKIPLLNKLRVELRLLICLTVLLALFIVPIVLANQPKLIDRIVGKHWCVSEVYYMNEPISLDESVYDVYFNNCKSILTFNENGEVRMSNYTGFTPLVRWEESGDGLFLTVDRNNTFYPGKPYFEGEYQLKIQGERLELWSKSMYIVCYNNTPKFL